MMHGTPVWSIKTAAHRTGVVAVALTGLFASAAFAQDETEDADDSATVTEVVEEDAGAMTDAERSESSPTMELPPSETFDGSVSPQYEFAKPVPVYFERIGRRSDGETGWLWGLSEGVYFFIQPINPKQRLSDPDRSKAEVFPEDRLKGIKGEKGQRWTYRPGENTWDQLAGMTVNDRYFTQTQQVTDVVGEMKEKEVAEAKAAEPVPEVVERAPEVERKPPVVPPSNQPPVPDAPVEVADEQPLDQIKNMPDLYKWIIGGAAVLIILWFVRR